MARLLPSTSRIMFWSRVAFPIGSRVPPTASTAASAFGHFLGLTVRTSSYSSPP